MFEPSVIANYFINKYGNDPHLTPMKVIKLVYIAYGWYLAITHGERLVNENPQAWNLGPVFPSLYHNLKKYGNTKIPHPIFSHNSTLEEGNFEEKIERFLDTIWNSYGKYDGIALSSITHTTDTPWSQVFPSGFNALIPDDLIQKHYEQKLELNQNKEQVAG